MAAIDINLGIFAVAAGTPDVITAAYTPTTDAFYNGLYKQFRASGANTVVAPTLNVDGLGAKAIVKKGGNALVVGDIAGAGHVCEVSYNSTSEKWELLNPASDESDTIWEENGGVITPQTISNLVRLGNGNTNWGQSPLEIYSEDNGVTALFIGDAGSSFMWILQTSTTFQILSSLPLELNADLVFASVAGIGIKLLQVNNDGEVDGSNVLPSDTTATTQSAGDNSTKVATTAYVKTAVDKQAEIIAISCSDLTTNLATGTSKGYLRMPFAMTLTAVRASVIDAPTGSTLIVDINEAGSTILSTKLTIDASEKTSTTAATPAVISDTALADDAEITVDIDQVGSTNTGKGLIVYLIGTRT